MNTRGRLISGLVTTVMALVGFGTAGTLPAAATASPVQYVALGDSYAAGVGATSDDPQPFCGRTDNGYPELLKRELRIKILANVACFGATTLDVAATVSELKRLGKLSPDTKLVTLTVGGADLGFRQVLTTCSVRPDLCAGAVNTALELLPDLESHLTNLYTGIAAAAPEARIVVSGYPLLFEPPYTNNPSDFSEMGVIDPVNNGGVALNKTIEDAVAAANDSNIEYVDVTKEFVQHRVLKLINDPYAPKPADPNAFIHSALICAPTTPDPTTDPCRDPAAYHPTNDGYDAYADAISAALPRGWLNKSSA